MADVTGTIGSESVVLNNAATEATLRLLLQATLNANKQSLGAIQQLAQSSGLSPQTVQAASQGLTSTGQAGRAAGQQLQGLNTSLINTGKIFGNLDDILKKATAGSLQSSDVAAALAQIPGPAGMVANVFQRIAEFQEANMRTYQQISSVGANFAGSLTGMRYAAAGTMMTLEQFGTMVTKNADILALMGGGVEAGTKAFTQLSKQLLTGDTGRQLMAMGYTTEQVNQGLLNYVGMIGGVTGAELKNVAVTKQLTESAGEYLGHLDGLARLTGQSREQQQKELAEAQKNAAFQAYMQTLSKEEQLKAQKGMASAMALGGKGAVDAFQSKLMGIAPDKAGAMFIATADKTAKVVDDMADMVKDGNAKSSDINKKTAEGMRAAQQDFAKYGREGLYAILRQGGPVADALQRVGITANSAALKTDEEIEAALKKAELDKTEADNMAQTNANLKQLGEAVIGIVSPIVSLLTPAFSILSGIVSSVATFIDSFPDPLKKFASIVTLAGVALMAYLAIMKKQTAAAAVGSVLPSGGGGVPGMGNAGATGAGIGNFLQGLGSGVGSIMKGLATGLQSFNNPAILLGATIFGGSVAAIIATIGAGIAAASWIMGKALPTLSEGIDSFARIDGDRLVTTAKGITALGGALVAFSAAGALAGVGNVFSNIIGGITKFFGGDDITTKISNMVAKFTPLAPQLSVLGPSIQSLGTGLLDFSKAINSIDITKAEKVRELLANYSATEALKTVTNTTEGTPSPATSGGTETLSASFDSLNKTLTEILKYTKEMTDNTKRTMEGVKSLNPNLFPS